MATEPTERVRAWVLLKAKNPYKAAEALYKALGHEGGDNWVVVRADVVQADDHGYTMVVPVDVREDFFDIALGKIEDYAPDVEKVVVRVAQHHPSPPHDAHGYIAEEEARPDEEWGRIVNSPRANAWG